MSGKFTVKNFSVVVPVFNEEDIVLQSAAQIYDICKRKKLDFELIFVENGSKDKTPVSYTHLTLPTKQAV